MHGQGCDGASAMSRQFNGVQACIREKNPLAVYTHCASHVLNPVVSHGRSAPFRRSVRFLALQQRDKAYSLTTS